MPIVLRLLGLKPGEEMRAAKQVLELGPRLVCVTRAHRGSFMVSRRAPVEHDGFSVRVKDTIGAGDGFTAALVHEYLHGASLEKMNDAANRMGSWVATQAGGTPVICKEELGRVLAKIK